MLARNAILSIVDIKPENILLTDKELHVKLADFGLAKIIGEESFTTTL